MPRLCYIAFHRSILGSFAFRSSAGRNLQRLCCAGRRDRVRSDASLFVTVDLHSLMRGYAGSDPG